MIQPFLLVHENEGGGLDVMQCLNLINANEKYDSTISCKRIKTREFVNKLMDDMVVCY